MSPFSRLPAAGPFAALIVLAPAFGGAPCFAETTAAPTREAAATAPLAPPGGASPSEPTPTGPDTVEAAPAEAAPAGTVPTGPGPAPAPPEPPEVLQQRLSTCSIPQEAEFLGLEWARRTSYRSVCLASHWLDGLFGDQAFDPTTGYINGYFALVTEKRRNGSWDTAPRLRTRIRLPQASKRFDLFFDRDKESQSIAGETPALRPESTVPSEESSNQLGIGYELSRGLDELLNLRLGLRIRALRPELFVRSRYSVLLADTEAGRWNLEQTLFWIKGDGIGETTALEYQRHLGGPFIFRWQGSGTLSQQSDGLRWNSNLSIFHALDADRALHWSFGGNGETGQVEPIAAYGPRVSYRERLSRRWLVVEVYTGVDRVQTETMPIRVSQAYVGARIEAHFSPP